MPAYTMINTGFLENFTSNDPVKIKKYIAMFLESAPDAIRKMKSLYSEKDWHNLKTTAHGLKPQLAYMGITELKETIARIEEYAGEEKNFDLISHLIDTVEKNCSIAFLELQDVIRTLPLKQ